MPLKTFFFLLLISTLTIPLQAQEKEKIDVLLVGFDHLSQMDDGPPASNIFSDKKQKEIKKLVTGLADFEPDMVMIEREPKEQQLMDSLYMAFEKGELKLADLEGGSSETFQVGFRLTKKMGLKGVHGIDHYESTSQSLLKSGTNFDLFKNGLMELISTARPLKKKVQQDSLSIYEYIKTMNRPELVTLSHNLIFNLPAYVIDGKFSEDGTNTVDIGSIDERYIGAEYITLFYNRNLKIYSNILNVQLQNRAKRIVLIMGQLHIGVLSDLLGNNPNYNLVKVSDYLK